MSMTKRALPEDIDVTDPRDSGAYGTEEPTASDWAMAEINNALITLEKKGAIGYVAELKEYRARLQDIIDRAVQPF